MSEILPCIDCHEERGSCPEGRCRDCDIEHIALGPACRECFSQIWREEVSGPLPLQHKPGCSLATCREYWARDTAETQAIRNNWFGIEAGPQTDKHPPETQQ